LTKLENLNLFSNQLKCVPKEIVNLKNLKKVDLEINFIKALPEELTKMKIDLSVDASLLSEEEDVNEIQNLAFGRGRRMLNFEDIEKAIQQDKKKLQTKKTNKHKRKQRSTKGNVEEDAEQVKLAQDNKHKKRSDVEDNEPKQRKKRKV